MPTVDRLSKAIMQLTGSKLAYRDTVILFASGKKACFSDLADICIEQRENGISAVGFLGDNTLRISVSRKAENMFVCGAVLTPGEMAADPVRRIDGFLWDVGCDANTCVLHHDFLNEGIHDLQNLNTQFISQHWFSLWQKETPENAVSFLAGLNAKFYSEVGVDRQEEKVSLRLSTTIPYSYKDTVHAEVWNLYVGTEPFRALEKNALLYGSDSIRQTPVGWSTWDYFFTSATEVDVREQVDFIAADPVLKDKVQYIALDDGWQQREGDWRSGCRYPSGLKELTRYIASKGYRAGIWIAPTRLHFLCGTVMRRNAFLSRDAVGDPIMDEDMYMLDPTNPDGEQFLRETFTYLADCGFTFYKLDFISNVFKMERFYDCSAGPYDALAKLFRIVRETVPEGSHIMGCSLPYGMGDGFVDSRRTGLDIHNTYKHLIQCTEGYLPQFASNERIYRNDLDYLVVRGPDTSDDPVTNPINPAAGRYKAEPTKRFRWRDGEDFTYNEAKMWCGIMLMSGSSIFLGDKLTALNERGLSLVHRTVSEADFRAAVPEIEPDASLPQIWRKGSSLYLFNFGNTPREYCVNAYGVYRDIFTDAIWKAEGRLCVTLEGHDCLCLRKTEQ